jgi:hypothetical protein
MDRSLTAVNTFAFARRGDHQSMVSGPLDQPYGSSWLGITVAEGVYPGTGTLDRPGQITAERHRQHLGSDPRHGVAADLVIDRVDARRMERTSSSSSPRCGIGTSSNSSTSGSPNPWMRIAFIVR